MNLINNTTYQQRYRPLVAYGRLTIKYYPEHLREQAKTNPDRVKPVVKEYTSKLTTFTIDHYNKFTTQNLYEAALSRIVREMLNNKKKKLFAWISKIQIIDTCGTVNYKFDQNLH